MTHTAVTMTAMIYIATIPSAAAVVYSPSSETSATLMAMPSLANEKRHRLYYLPNILTVLCRSYSRIRLNTVNGI